MSTRSSCIIMVRLRVRSTSRRGCCGWAINRCRDLTRAAHQKDTELDENLPAPDAFEDGSVLDAVRALPENYRNAIYLHYYEGYTAAEIGRMMGAPSNTVLSWLRRARAQLHTMLKEEIEDEVV